MFFSEGGLVHFSELRKQDHELDLVHDMDLVLKSPPLHYQMRLIPVI